MDNTALLEPDSRASFTAKPYTVPLPERHDTGQAIPLPGMTLTGDPPAEETEELPRAGSAVRRMEKSRRRIPLFQLFAAAAEHVGVDERLRDALPPAGGRRYFREPVPARRGFHRNAAAPPCLGRSIPPGGIHLRILRAGLAAGVARSARMRTGNRCGARRSFHRRDKRRACGYSCRGFRVRGCVRRRDFTEYVVADITAGFLALRRGHGFPCRRGIHPALPRLVRHIHRLRPAGMRPALPAYRVRVRSRVRSEYFADQPLGLQP